MKQEPVAWMWENDAWIGVNNFSEEKPSAYPNAIPLYTAPRELSDEEIDSVIVESFIGVLCGFYMFQDRPKEMQENYEVVLRFARAILKKASEK